MPNTINPLAALIQDASLDSGIVEQVGDRIAARHRFGGAWSVADETFGARALILRLDGGLAQIHTEAHIGRIEANCYGGNVAQAFNVYRALKSWVRPFERKVITTTDGLALAYFLTFETEASQLEDPELALPYFMAILNFGMAEEDVPA